MAIGMGLDRASIQFFIFKISPLHVDPPNVVITRFLSQDALRQIYPHF